MEQNDKPRHHDGTGDALAIAFELVATPALFAFFGWLIDRALGTTPGFTIGLCLVVAVYTSWKAMAAYNARMQAFDRALPSYSDTSADPKATDG